MDEFSVYTLQQLCPGKVLFKKGEYYSTFYLLTEGAAHVTINQISIDISAPMLLGDYEILNQIDYRISEIKALTRCTIKVIPLRSFKRDEIHLPTLDTSFKKLGIKNRLFRYWLNKLFHLHICHKNEQIGSNDSIGIILAGQFLINRDILIKNIKLKKLQVLRRFELCLMAPCEIFQGRLTCETGRGVVAVCQPEYLRQLQTVFVQFSHIIKLVNMKEECHSHLTKDIARSCKDKAKLFEQMVPLSLKNHSNHQEEGQSSTSSLIKDTKLSPLRDTKGKMIKDEVFSVKDNISQFLHQQWRMVRGMSTKHKNKMSLNISSHFNKSPQQSPHKKLSLFSNSELISLSIPKQFRQQKFKMKMLIKTPDPHGGCDIRRLKTQHTEQPKKKKLIFN